MNSEAEITTDNGTVQIAQTSNYPWEGNIMFEIKNEIPAKASLHIRVPGWVKNEPAPGDLYSYVNASETEPVFYVNGKIRKVDIAENGYAKITGKWQKGDKVEVVFPMEVKRIMANEKVKEDRGLMAFEYGPVVYCAEGYDNNGKVLNIYVNDDAEFDPGYTPGVLSGINILKGKGRLVEGRLIEDIEVNLIPYYAWNNRGEGEMAVWLKTK